MKKQMKKQIKQQVKQHFNCLLTKFLFFGPAIGILLPFFSSVKLSGAIIIALAATLATYLTADLVVLPRYGNLPALVLDAAIAVLVAWEFALVIYNTPISVPGMLFMAVVIMAGEWYYHGYVFRILFNRRGGKR
jgi:Protein of unknown function (DUF2512).